MITRKLVSGAALVAALATLPGAGGHAQSAAQPLTAFSISYTVHARGVAAAHADYSFTFSSGRYSGTASSRLIGFARTLGGSDQDYSYAVSGVIDGSGQLRPRSYRHTGGSRGRVVQVAFTDSAVTTTATPAMGMGNPPATPAQKLNTVDQVTMMADLLTSTGDPCRQTVRVFMDGRARFDLVLGPNGTQRVNIGGFRGQALRCSVRFAPIAGFPDPAEPATLTFLFAPHQGYFVPLQIQMPTDDAGVVRLEARRFSVTGQR
jgi:hypothetical protein